MIIIPIEREEKSVSVYVDANSRRLSRGVRIAEVGSAEGKDSLRLLSLIM